MRDLWSLGPTFKGVHMEWFDDYTDFPMAPGRYHSFAQAPKFKFPSISRQIVLKFLEHSIMMNNDDEGDDELVFVISRDDETQFWGLM